ncbi:MAG: hypothetical protein J5791_02675 [Fibrobacter sp.]|nr:hypothetical protein [Fibrobacter sp.]
MKIEKRKISGGKPLSATAKSAIAATLGMAAAFTLNACDDSSSAKDDNAGPGPLGGIVAPDEYRGDPESSSEAASPASSSETAEPETSSETVSPASSSSKTVDIPLSQEPVSSSLMDAISSALESSSSEAAPTSSTIAPESSAITPTSSETVPTSSAIAPESSSETVQPGSSSVTPASSSSINGWGDPVVNPCEGVPAGTEVEYGGRLYLCPNSSSSGGGMMFSMISTFERTDVEV